MVSLRLHAFCAVAMIWTATFPQVSATPVQLQAGDGHNKLTFSPGGIQLPDSRKHVLRDTPQGPARFQTQEGYKIPLLPDPSYDPSIEGYLTHDIRHEKRSLEHADINDTTSSEDPITSGSPPPPDLPTEAEQTTIDSLTTLTTAFLLALQDIHKKLVLIPSSSPTRVEIQNRAADLLAIMQSAREYEMGYASVVSKEEMQAVVDGVNELVMEFVTFAEQSLDAAAV